ncbi:ThiF family adenylyltransferase [Gimesia panareensis]|uniref:Molybdopterin-synthase adenylyltransferase n=1 Tax=Gimesia panareensis TaxID=2527978 RepID=A0A517QGR8_9PLAN|nr:ThiF family adenylyltransferase [Gimesia panareensis]QDT30747.1 Molybdopterin-synthase adenylyltransferase [Gimesia panareensis]QDU53796.1 Molybdopterin-synthase adenylyltransferase [Gimesia panareensis]
MKPELERYSRQVLFSELGEAGQTRLMQGRVLLCGCGALGTVLAETLVRAGVGQIKIVDRDFVEISNLQRQVLFDETDVAARLPKAIAAAEKLKKINSTVHIEPIVADIDHTNILSLAEDVDLILDGTDNFEVRYLINDVSLELGIPWIYCGCIGSTGQTMTVLPGKTACLRCLIDTAPEPGSTETCDTAGILGPTVNVIASLEAVDAIKLLAGKEDLIRPVLTVVDIWEGSYRQMSVADLREKSGCKACHQGERIWLKGEQGSRTTRLCGRNAVQVAPADKGKIAFEDLAEKLKHSGEVDFNPYLLRLNLKNPDYEISLFRDGRAIIKGTDDPAVAKTVYARYIGS